jgi:hypothetical protein
MPLAAEPPALFVRAVAFAVLRTLPQPTVKIPTMTLGSPYVLIDRFVRDPEQTVAGQPSRNLLGTQMARRRSSTSFQSSTVNRLFRLERDRRPLLAS